MPNKYPSTLLAQSNDPLEIQKADLDLLKKINEVYDKVISDDISMTLNIPITSEWTVFPLVITATTTNPTLNANAVVKAIARRVGQSMEVQFNIYQASAGTAGSGTYIINLPVGYNPWSGYTLDAGYGNVVGQAYFDVSTTNTIGVIRLNANAQLFVQYFTSTAVGGGFTESSWGSASFALSNAGLNISGSFSIRINEWTLPYETVAISNMQPVNGTITTTTTSPYEIVSDEFFNPINGISGWEYTAAGSGTFTTAPNAGLTTSQHEGLMFIRSSATANSGIIVRLSNNRYLIKGGEKFKCIWRPTGAVASRTTYVGIHNSVTVTAPTDGIYFALAGTTFTATLRISSVNIFADVVPNVTADINTWYRVEILVNTDGAGFDMYLYNDDTNALLFTKVYTGALPTVLTTPAFTATMATAAASDICHIDYIEFQYLKPNNRT